jgi:hypothetical protein
MFMFELYRFTPPLFQEIAVQTSALSRIAAFPPTAPAVNFSATLADL